MSLSSHSKEEAERHKKPRVTKPDVTHRRMGMKSSAVSVAHNEENVGAPLGDTTRGGQYGVESR